MTGQFGLICPLYLILFIYLYRKGFKSRGHFSPTPSNLASNHSKHLASSFIPNQPYKALLAVTLDGRETSRD